MSRYRKGGAFCVCVCVCPLVPFLLLHCQRVSDKMLKLAYPPPPRSNSHMQRATHACRQTTNRQAASGTQTNTRLRLLAPHRPIRLRQWLLGWASASAWHFTRNGWMDRRTTNDPIDLLYRTAESIHTNIRLLLSLSMRTSIATFGQPPSIRAEPNPTPTKSERSVRRL